MFEKNSIPDNNEPLTLFRYSVQKVCLLGLMGESKTHQAWANLIFNYEKNSGVRNELMSIVKREYTAYFDKELQYMFLGEKIKANFPECFGKEKDIDLFFRIDQALGAEYTEQKNPKNRKKYRISSFSNLASQENLFIYKVHLKIDEGEDNPQFSEGTPVDFHDGNISHVCEVVEFDYVNAVLFFSSSQRIYSSMGAYVESDASMNTFALKKHLKEISEQHSIKPSQPLYKFLSHTTGNLTKISYGPYPSYLDEKLSGDGSQYDAFKAALGNDLTFVWGPPGTGKSYTLAAIIMALYQLKGERTAVCCLSNVAVDQLVNKVIDIIFDHGLDISLGQFYRAGRTQDERLIATDFLYPTDSTVRLLRLRINRLNQSIDKYKQKNQQYSDEAIKEKAKLKDLREKLKERTDYVISNVRVVFSTISNFVLNSRLKDGCFDNLIVDEASMLALPQLIALACRVTKRIVLVGDFQQLSPITIAGVPLLRDNVFKICGIDINHTDHPALHQLLNQRRSNPKLVDIINHSFYNDRLEAKNSPYHPIVARAPYSGIVVGMSCVREGIVRFTKGGTRQNVANAEVVMNLLDIYSQEKEDYFSIGVITPYTGQVALLKALFSKKAYDQSFQERVKIGTVHTFQGSECDVILFDMVDCSRFEKSTKSYFGRIYAGEQGEQLLNVAISRARHKLIVICDPDFISERPGNTITDRSYGIFKKLLAARWTKM